MGPYTNLLLRQLSGPIQECWQHLLGNCMGPYNILGSTPEAAPWAHIGVLAVFFRQMCGPIQKPQQYSSGRSLGPSRSADCNVYAAAWAHAETSAALFRQLSGPIQECWQQFLGRCMGPIQKSQQLSSGSSLGPYRSAGSNFWAGVWAHTETLEALFEQLWAHPGVLAAIFRQMCGPIQQTWQHSSGSSMGPFKIISNSF